MRQFLESKFFPKIVLVLILLLGACFRFYGLDWDQGQHLHPDERFLTMVTTAIKIPPSPANYFDPKSSTMNPYNANFSFFVYGTLPLTITKIVATILNLGSDYNGVTLIGRSISGIFDLGTVFLIFLTARITFPPKKFGWKIPILASFFYAISVLPIQLSHFFAVDTFLVFFITLSYYLLIIFLFRQSILGVILLGASLGLAIACKVSAVLFLPVVGLGIFFSFLNNRKTLSHKLAIFSIYFLTMCLVFYVSLRIGDPKFFSSGHFLNPTINPHFIDNLKSLAVNPKAPSPPAVQWFGTAPILFPLKNLILWGVGLPLGLLSITGMILTFIFLVRTTVLKIKKKLLGQNSRAILLAISLFWIVLLFIYEGTKFGKAMRYFLPVYPSLSIISAFAFYKFYFNFGKTKIFSVVALLFLTSYLIWPLAFSSIYSQPHSRVTASEWIYKNIPPGSTISCEHWDDCLPLNLEGLSGNLYKIEFLSFYDADVPEKWSKINNQLDKVEYLIMSSNRLWGSIPRAPHLYPLTSKFYRDLLSGKSNFQKFAEITSYPSLKIGTWEFQINDSSSDESFTVYDHPQVLIYKKRVLP